jgi:gliding motility associated protien GldN
MNKLFSVLLLIPILCFSQADLLNTKKSSEIKAVSKEVDENAKPLDYEYVSDDDILFSITTWEVIDLDQRVNFPLYYPTEINTVTDDRRPLIHYLLQAIEDPLIGAQAFTDPNLTDRMDSKDIKSLREFKRLKKGVEADGNTEGEEHFDIAGSWKVYLESLGYDFPEDEDWVGYDPLSDEYRELILSGEAKLATSYKEKWYAVAEEIMPEENFNSQEFEYGDVRKYLLKGIWYFDKKSTQLRFRPIALGPVAMSPEDKFDSDDEQSTDNTNNSETDDFGWGGDGDDENQENEEVTEAESEAEEVEEDEGDSVVEAEAEKDDEKEYRAMFWVFFPEVRDILHRAFASNNKNMSKPISFDHLINSRRFSGRIYKEANVFQDRDVRKYIGANALMQLLESQRIKEKIRNLEQDMWSY